MYAKCFVQNFCGICILFIFCLKLLFRKCITYVLGCRVTSVFVLVNGIIFNSSNVLMIKCLTTCLMN